MSATMRTRTGVDRLALAFLMAVLAVGSLAMWTAVPLAVLWGISLLDVSTGAYVLLAVVSVPAAITLAATALLRINDLYVRVDRSGVDDSGSHSRGPLEWLVVGALFVAIALMIAWLVFVSGDPFPWTQPTA